MTEKTAVIVKNVIGSYFLMLGLGCIGLFIYMVGQFSTAVYVDAVIIYCAGLAFLILVFSSLTYGLYRGRRWVIRLHLAILLVWLVMTGPYTLLAAGAIWGEGAPSSLLYFIFVWIVPISIQLFMHFKLREHLPRTPPLSLIQKIGFVAAVVYSAVVVLLAAGIIFGAWAMWGGA